MIDMKAQQIISTRRDTINDDATCGCGEEKNLFVVEYENEFGHITGDYPSLLQCQRCLSNARAEAEWFSHH